MIARAWWLDTRLAKAIGRPDHAARASIDEVLHNVVGDVLGIGDDPLRGSYLDRHTPWVRDLGRGMHWLSLGRPVEAPTAQLLDIVGQGPLMERLVLVDDGDAFVRLREAAGFRVLLRLGQGLVQDT